ncbi:glycoside hydrolase family 88 protein [Treponema sp. OttesenSCG-928-L16]|nr:glycoside hydrolase family 88 protein [Treponema sp. OttesenSCG-928-L16]
MADSVMGRYKPEQVQWHYEHGLVLQSIYAVGLRSGDPKYGEWVRMMYDTKINDDGSINTYREEDYNLDQINAGKMLFDLYASTGAQKYRTAIEKLRNQLREQPRTQSMGFWHKKIYPWQMWLDGLYMQGPFYARYVAEFEGGENFEDVIHQFVLMESKVRDEATGLLYHAWDESRKQIWANPQTGCSPHFWGRAMGWYCMALLDVLDFIPDIPQWQKGRESLKAIARRLLVPVMKYQDGESGLWYQVLDQGQRKGNYLESSASSMFVYFMYKMLRKDYADKSDASMIRNAAEKGYTGLIQRMVKKDDDGELHLHGICSVAGLGGNPYRDGSFAYYVKEPVVADDFKGVGPFILASLELESLK